MKALELLRECQSKTLYADSNCGLMSKELSEVIAELEELQEELRIANEAYAILLKQYHELKGEE